MSLSNKLRETVKAELRESPRTFRYLTQKFGISTSTVYSIKKELEKEAKIALNKKEKLEINKVEITKIKEVEPVTTQKVEPEELPNIIPALKEEKPELDPDKNYCGSCHKKGTITELNRKGQKYCHVCDEALQW